MFRVNKQVSNQLNMLWKLKLFKIDLFSDNHPLKISTFMEMFSYKIPQKLCNIQRVDWFNVIGKIKKWLKTTENLL